MRTARPACAWPPGSDPPRSPATPPCSSAGSPTWSKTPCATTSPTAGSTSPPAQMAGGPSSRSPTAALPSPPTRSTRCSSRSAACTAGSPRPPAALVSACRSCARSPAPTAATPAPGRWPAVAWRSPSGSRPAPRPAWPSRHGRPCCPAHAEPRRSSWRYRSTSRRTHRFTDAARIARSGEVSQLRRASSRSPGRARPAAGTGGRWVGALPYRRRLRRRRVPGEGRGGEPRGDGVHRLRRHLGHAAAVRGLGDGDPVLAAVTQAGAFARERLRRLGVPLLVGLVTLVPLQGYLGLRVAGDTSSYAGFYARFWQVRPSPDFPFVVTAAPGTGVFQTGHLWFLVCLLAFSLVLLPGFALLRRPPGTRLVERLAGLLARPGALLLGYGYLAAADGRIGEAFQRQWRPAMVVAVLLFAAGGSVYAAAAAHGDPFTGTDPLSIIFRLLKTVDGWLWVVAILGLARSRITRPRRSPARTAAGDRPDRASVMRRAGPGRRSAPAPGRDSGPRASPRW